ncbi:hypothetical protein CROQUDRAFT_657340 [Cronartium quercuum f. sp. fusiforme G11]|uniref:SigF-like NTF2-like domain-containing protein n=1 Tax=Cronartium quercuum f. sp. fusiforme G11 TaxID=708437 RepID=A0A9P6NLT5_9BASI|nr:hypothetical protein CROQUDRAFT_657340 [Cronartium quercuum f. sp. fusiforme G11]
MENPVNEVRDVVRGVTEPHDAAEIARNVEKYFTEDAIILHPALDLPRTPNSRDHIMGIYKWFRVNTINQKIWFNSVAFNEDFTICHIDLTEDLYLRNIPLISQKKFSGRLLVTLELKKCDDNKYRITSQRDTALSDISWTGLASGIFPLVGTLKYYWKAWAAIFAGTTGRFLLGRGWLGP